ncbi:MAG: hypothetical protein ABJQ23_04655 [Shimia thalassica]|uniref:hypothetical protein n=1 Tax=Shimia thalassica TaxID=1715693 RepID=UPI0032970894
MANLEAIFQLQSVLRQMESDLGLDGLSANEKSILLAVHNLAETNGPIVESFQMRRHILLEKVAQASFHRALRSLVDKGYLKKAGETKTKAYSLGEKLIEPPVNSRI